MEHISLPFSRSDGTARMMRAVPSLRENGNNFIVLSFS